MTVSARKSDMGQTVAAGYDNNIRSRVSARERGRAESGATESYAGRPSSRLTGDQKVT
ncbi:hypothetical protein Asi03nite_60960 [Actinoplanes siamensis]|uniref:Uncharacterized protein n=1 Tax=Actinoplanes siamensis TaxID=1223317 RepID=A0A919TNV5_9ACTN|nr:hypothetical protein Asi03nite_60960 [Actinoplanes siamensis]